MEVWGVGGQRSEAADLSLRKVRGVGGCSKHHWFDFVGSDAWLLDAWWDGKALRNSSSWGQSAEVAAFWMSGVLWTNIRDVSGRKIAARTTRYFIDYQALSWGLDEGAARTGASLQGRNWQQGATEGGNGGAASIIVE